VCLCLGNYEHWWKAARIEVTIVNVEIVQRAMHLMAAGCVIQKSGYLNVGVFSSVVYVQAGAFVVVSALYLAIEQANLGL